MADTLCKHHRRPAAAASRRRCRVCAVVSLAALLLVAAVVAALAVTALRPHATSATLERLRLASLSVSPAGPSGTPPPSLNATFVADLAVRNPSSLAAFAHDAGRAEVYYRGALAADADLPPGRVAAGGTEAMTVRLTVLADRLALRAPQLYGDFVAGEVPLTVRTVLPGKATVLGVLRRRVVVTTVCDVVVSVRSPGAETSSTCRYRTKLL